MQALNIFHVLIAVALIAFVLVQRGQGATAGAAFGSGASGTVFGARGAGNFLSRSTWVLAALFCAISLIMAVMVSRMMTETPEADLGVVSTIEQAGDAAGSEETGQPSLISGDERTTDLPALEQPEEDVPALDGFSEQGVGEPIDDLPPLDSADGATEPRSDDG